MSHSFKSYESSDFVTRYQIKPSRRKVKAKKSARKTLQAA